MKVYNTQVKVVDRNTSAYPPSRRKKERKEDIKEREGENVACISQISERKELKFPKSEIKSHLPSKLSVQQTIAGAPDPWFENLLLYIFDWMLDNLRRHRNASADLVHPID